jgi:UDP-glucuronate 4-epimerase
MKILVTGSAGFIGSALTLSLLERGDEVIGVDNHNDYYDQGLKEDRVKRYYNNLNYDHYRIDISDQRSLDEVFKKHNPQKVVNLAAQAGVRYSLENPISYIKSNVVGFANILECCKKFTVDHLVYASTSSVYGANTKVPFSEDHSTNHPLSVYAASKKSNELMAHSYSHLYNLPTTGLRFFTVYGPWGRPDMSPIKFTKSILSEKTIDVYNFGKHIRDFTYIDDIVGGIIKTIDTIASSNEKWNSDSPDLSTSKAPWKIYNIGNNKEIKLLDYINALENALNKKAKINFLPLQPGDVLNTCADMKKFMHDLDFKATTEIKLGVEKFVSWYLNYYK